MDKKENAVNITITQDKLVDILMHSATREDLSKLGDKVDKCATREDLSKLSDRVDLIDAKLNNCATKDDLSKLDLKLSTRMDRLDSRMNRLESRMDKQFMFLISFVTLSIISPIAVSFVSHLIR